MTLQKLDNVVLDTQITTYRTMYGTGFNRVASRNPAPYASDAYAWAVGIWAIVLGLVGAVTVGRNWGRSTRSRP